MFRATRATGIGNKGTYHPNGSSSRGIDFDFEALRDLRPRASPEGLNYIDIHSGAIFWKTRKRST